MKMLSILCLEEEFGMNIGSIKIELVIAAEVLFDFSRLLSKMTEALFLKKTVLRKITFNRSGDRESYPGEISNIKSFS